MAQLFSLGKLLVRAGGLRPLTPLHAASVAFILRFKIASPRGFIIHQSTSSIRASFVLVVPGLIPVPRRVTGARGWWQIRHDQSHIGVSVLQIGIRLGLQISKPDDSHGNANGEFIKIPRLIKSLIFHIVCFVLFYLTIFFLFTILSSPI